MLNLFKYTLLPLIATGTLQTSTTIAPAQTVEISIISSGSLFYTGEILQRKKSPIHPIGKMPIILKKSDSDIARFVSRSVGLDDPLYAPSDLVSIAGKYINEAGRQSSLRKEANDALQKMAEAFYKEFDTSLVVISAYRSAAYQQRLWDLGRCSPSLCAPVGHSEHQLGLAIDMFDATTKDQYLSNPKYRGYVEWMQSNAHLYGYHQSYQKGEAIDEYEVEPWHWRYLGKDLATKLYDLGWTFREYTQFQESLSWLR